VILLPSKEPLFASRAQAKGKFVVYYDRDGFPACTNFTISANSRLCSVCGNACCRYMIEGDQIYICSACGQFPRELLVN